MHDNNKYYINVMHNAFSGSFFWGFGTILSNECRFTVCKEKQPAEYELMTQWINKNTSVCTIKNL